MWKPTQTQRDVFRFTKPDCSTSDSGLVNQAFALRVSDVMLETSALVLRWSTTGRRWRWTLVWGRRLFRTYSRTPVMTSRSPAPRGTWADSDTAYTPRPHRPSWSAGPRWTTRERPKPPSPSYCRHWTPGATWGANGLIRRSLLECTCVYSTRRGHMNHAWHVHTYVQKSSSCCTVNNSKPQSICVSHCFWLLSSGRKSFQLPVQRWNTAAHTLYSTRRSDKSHRSARFRFSLFMKIHVRQNGSAAAKETVLHLWVCWERQRW